MFTIAANTCRKAACCLAFAVILFFQHTALSQVKDLVFEHLTVGEGLSDNAVWTVLQDHRGFMWFGTANGLNKYDGYRFTVYKAVPLDSNSVRLANMSPPRSGPLLYEDKSGTLWLQGPGFWLTRFDRLTEKFTGCSELGAVRDLWEDEAGALWFATLSKGLNKFERTSGTFTQYKLSSDTLTCIFEDSSGPGRILWIGGFGGLDRFDPVHGTYTHVGQFLGDRARRPRGVTAIYKDRVGILWIGTNEGLYTLDEATGTVRRCSIFRWRSTVIYTDYVHSLYEDSKGILWIGAGEELISFERATGRFLHFGADSLPIPQPIRVRHQVCEDRTGSLWLRMLGKGLSRFEPANNTIVSYVYDPNDPSSLNDNAVNQIYGDRSGSLWIATVWGGVNKVDRARKAFRHYTRNPAYSWSLTQNTVHGICEDRSGRVWVATRGGLERFDKKTGMFTHFRHDPADPHSLSSNIIRAVVEDHEGTIWVGTETRGLDRLDPVRGGGERTAKARFRHYTHDPRNPLSIGSNHIYKLFVDRSGKIWIGMSGVGLDQFSKDTGIFVHYRFDPRLGSDQVNAICEDNRGGLWVGTGAVDPVVFHRDASPLHRLDRATGKFVHFKWDPGNPKSIRPGSVHSICEDRGGSHWIGTTFGLSKFEPLTETFTRIEASRDIADDCISGIMEDGSGCLWLKTSKGVSKFDPRTDTFRSYDRSDGVPIRPTWEEVCCKGRDGELYFGGTNGFVRFHPDSIKDNAYIPPVVITAFKIFDKPVSLDTVISEKTLLQLSYQDNVISFEFVALNYSSPEKNQYAYKLEGFDDDWTYCGTRRYASYTNVDAGSYVFRVKGSNNDGVWNEEGTSIAVIIAPPWWKTTWAYIGYGLAGVLLLYGLRRYDRKRAQLKHDLQMEKFEAEKLREIDGMKMRFFSNVSHEFRTPLTLILGPAEKLLSKLADGQARSDIDIIRRSALRLLELINQLLDISKVDAGRMKMQVQQIDLVRFVKGLVFSFASLAERKRIRLDFDAGEKPIPAYVDRDKLQKIVVNLLSNAFKFTPEAGEVRVGVSVVGKGMSGQSREPEGTRGEASLAARGVASVSLAGLNDITSGKSRGSETAAEFAEISVSDTGVGIPQEKLEKIFERFYQVDDSHVREYEGTGIGLALTRELVEIHHGQISVTSEPGKGSTFRVRLPLGKEQWKEEEIVESTGDSDEVAVKVPVELEEVPRAHETEEPVERESGGERSEPTPVLPLVLVVEDNADVRSYIRSSLTPEYRILEAEDGVGGLESASEVMPDLIVSDIMMPRMDGIELCRRLKTDERTSHIPVILLTARASDAGKLEGLETGADDYIIKPFDVKELQVRIRNLIEMRRKLREKYRRQCVLEPGDIPIESMDEKFLRKALEVVEQHLSEPDFETAVLAREVCMSRMQLNRKLQALTGRSTHEFIRNLRLQRAAKLLASHWGTVTEVAYEVGFSSLSSFARAFREQYGVAPSEYGAHHVDSA